MVPHDAKPFVALGVLPLMVLEQAYEAAVRRRADSVGTIDVLAHLAISDRPGAQGLLADSRAGLARMVANPHTMPTWRSPGELGPQPETDFDFEAQAVLREVEWRVRRMAGLPGMLGRADVEHWQTRPRWTAGVEATLAGALTAARQHAVPFADLIHLLLAMLRLPGCDGTRFVFPYDHVQMDALEWLSRDPNLRRSGRPHPSFEASTMVARQASPTGRLAKWFFTPLIRLSRVAPLLADVRVEARRQAVRVGHDVIGPAHTLLAMLTVDATLEAIGVRTTADHAGLNRGAFILRAVGVTADRLREVTTSRGGPEDPPAEVLAEQLGQLRLGDPAEGAEVRSAWHRAGEISLACRHRTTGTNHLLLALVEDGAGEAASILRALGLDAATFRERVRQDPAFTSAA